MEIRKVTEDIWEIENLLFEEEVEYLLSVARTSENPSWYSEEQSQDWSGRVMNVPLAYGQNSKETEILLKLAGIIEELFINMTKYVQPYSILRTRTGEFFPYHSDSVTDIYNVFGLVFYLNDDYTGGELDYKDLNIIIKPKANSMLIHRAHLIHGVKEVTSGTRYAVSSFIEGDKTTAIREN
jgi:hypothetical protein